MNTARLTLAIMENAYAVCRFQPDAADPSWVPASGFISVTRTQEELSIVCLEDSVPADIQAERGFRILKIEGPLDFSLTGILLAVAGPLADAKISIFALSTFDTDYVLVPSADLEKAVAALEAAGHRIGGHR